MPVDTIMVEKVEIIEGISKKTNKPYRSVVLTDGNGERYSDFGVEMFEVAKPFEGKKAKVDWTQNGNYRNLLSVKAAENGDVPTLGTGDYVRGQTAPADKLSIWASVALKEAVQTLGPRAAASPAKTIDIYKAITQLADLYFVWLQRKNGFQIDDKDVPF